MTYYREESVVSGATARRGFGGSLDWPAVVAGAFVALTLLLIAGILARALGLDFTFQTAQTATLMAGAVLWGAIAALVSFGAGGLIACKIAEARGRGSGTINGFMVWAVTVPLLVYFVGSTIGPTLGPAGGDIAPGAMVALPATQLERFEAMPAAAQEQPLRQQQFEREVDQQAAPAQVNGRAEPMPRQQAAAWWALLSLGLGLVGAAGAAYMVGHRDGINTRETGAGGTTMTT